jgi:hypothetical protein
MPTKPIADTGWTDKYPYKSGAGDEYYFVDRKDRNDVVIMGFSMGVAWLNGISYEPSELRSHLFLGPLSPDDFEQLIQLRKAGREANEALQLIQGFDFQLDSSAHGEEIRRRAINAIAALREALAPTEEKL